jgi:hypothetical protein
MGIGPFLALLLLFAPQAARYSRPKRYLIATSGLLSAQKCGPVEMALPLLQQCPLF